MGWAGIGGWKLHGVDSRKNCLGCAYQELLGESSSNNTTAHQATLTLTLTTPPPPPPRDPPAGVGLGSRSFPPYFGVENRKKRKGFRIHSDSGGSL